MKTLLVLAVVAVAVLFGWQWFQFHSLDVPAVEADLRQLPLDGLVDQKAINQDSVEARLEKSVADRELVLTAHDVAPASMLCQKPQQNVPGVGKVGDRGTLVHAFTVTGTVTRRRLGLTLSAPLKVEVHEACTDGQLVPVSE